VHELVALFFGGFIFHCQSFSFTALGAVPENEERKKRKFSGYQNEHVMSS